MIKDLSLMALGFTVTSVALAAPAQAPADVKAGVEAWERGGYRDAVGIWRPLAIAGDPDAQFNLAQAYKLGRGVPVDLILAQEWYHKAALQGHRLAEDNYGLSLFQNGDHVAALPWLQKSAARGEPRAQLVLGTMLFNGDSVEKDWVKAYAWLTRSSASGLEKGSTTLAEMDRYISADDRRAGIELARQYETEALRLQRIADTQAGPAPQIATAAPPPSAPRALQVAAATPAPQPAPASHPANAKPVPVKAVPTPAALPNKIAATGAWRVQFGAFKDAGNARALWSRLQPKVEGLKTLQPSYVKAGDLTRLQAGPVESGTVAARLCAQVKLGVAGTPCVPVAP